MAAGEKIKTMSLRVELDEKAVKVRSRELADLTAEHGRMERDLKRDEEEWKENKAEKTKEINSMLYRLRELATTVQTESEMREVEVKEIRDYKRGVVEKVRTDTGELVATREMVEGELQSELFAREPAAEEPEVDDQEDGPSGEAEDVPQKTVAAK